MTKDDIMKRKIVYRLFVSITFLAMLISMGGASQASASTALGVTSKSGNFIFQKTISGLDEPIFITNAGDGSGRLFIVERSGLILIYKNGAVLPTPFLDLRSTVFTNGEEEGLLTLAFHPNYSTNGRFFVVYNTGDFNTMNFPVNLAEFAVSSGNPDIADPTSGHILLSVPHPDFQNHNGGTLAFGPDGYLYWSVGDGGSGGDPSDNAQNLNRLLGKLLRIDVNSGSPYAIPPSNPFASGGGRGEIWAYGLRNPWRFSFDRLTGDIYIGDVGQGKLEEVDFQPASSTGGENYGWNIMEGTNCYPPSTPSCNKTGLTLPITVYTHAFGCAIIGGYVYRGSLFPPIQGYYFYSDECSGIINALHHDPIRGWVVTRVADTPYNVSTFGQDENGELYFADLGAGDIYKICYNTDRAGPAPRTISPRRAPRTPCPAP
jgi:glucose/arabinose dehydrogenase